jgi:hypothetical protein
VKKAWSEAVPKHINEANGQWPEIEFVAPEKL